MINALFRLTTAVFKFLETFLSPVLFLIIRLWMAKIFFVSGMIKIKSWSSTLYLFRNEYRVPLIDPYFAAVSATTVELIAPILLTLGLLTRFAATPMLVMAFVIQFTYLQLNEHYYWMMLLGLLVLKGPGNFSMDYFITKKYKAFDM